MSASAARDLELPLFPLGNGTPRVPRTNPELAVAVPASSRPIWLHGTRTSVLSVVRGTDREIRMDGRLVVTDLNVEAGPVANAVVSPGILRRERIGPQGSTEETILAAPTLPLAVLAWHGVGPAGLTLTALPEAPDIRWHAEGSAATVASPDSDYVLALTCAPETGTWRAESRAGGGVRLHCTAPGGIQALVVAHGSRAAVRSALAGARHLEGHTARAGARLREELLILDSGVPALDEAVAWMQHRLSAGIRLAAEGEGEAPSGAWLWAGLGACAVGDTGSASRCVQVLDRRRCQEEAALLEALVALTTGQPGSLLERLAPPATALGRLALRLAADALRYAAPEPRVTALRHAGREPQPAAPSPSSGTGRRLPTLDGPGASGAAAVNPADTLGHALAYLLEEDSAARRPGWPGPNVPGAVGRTAPNPGSPEREAFEAWTALTAGDPDGWARWRGLVAHGLDRPEGGVAAWDTFDPHRPPSTTGILLAALAYGWLGARPDAPVGRLGLAPVVPVHVTEFRFKGVRIGDATVGLAYAREGTREGMVTHRFELTPQGGRVPPMVVFEPRLPATAVEAVLVDGDAADVEATSDDDTLQVRLQTPADGVRSIEIRTR